MSRPRAIGTAAETAAKRYLIDNGFPECDRQPLRGNRDQGDLIICRKPLVIAEVKAGQMAERASHTVIAEWMQQTETEAVHAGADLAVLIVRRFRRPVALWDAWLPAGDWAWLLGYERHQSWAGGAGDTVPLRGSLEDFARMVKAVTG